MGRPTQERVSVACAAAHVCAAAEQREFLPRQERLASQVALRSPAPVRAKISISQFPVLPLSLRISMMNSAKARGQ